MIAEPAEILITASIVPQNRRMAFLPALFGSLFLVGEKITFTTQPKS